jgi:hypothetical protein
MLARLGFEEFVDLLMACVCSVQYRVPYNDQETESLYLAGVFVKEIPANQRPYRYSYFQKLYIEKIMDNRNYSFLC